MKSPKRIFRQTSSCFAQLFLVMVVFGGASLRAADNTFDVFFPIVASGQFGAISLETAMVLTNPGSEVARVNLDLMKTTLDAPSSVLLTPGKTTVFFFK